MYPSLTTIGAVLAFSIAFILLGILLGILKDFRDRKFFLIMFGASIILTLVIIFSIIVSQQLYYARMGQLSGVLFFCGSFLITVGIKGGIIKEQQGGNVGIGATKPGIN
ncbi:MAG: hypothetical protein WC849_00820 [Candidatus Paceibacterota bacterium]